MNTRNILQDKWSDKFVEMYGKGFKKSIFHIFQRCGKIRTVLLTLKKLNFLNKKILISYPDNRIKDSWINDMKKFNINLTNVEFTNISSIKKHIDEIYDVFIFDECHKYSENQAKSLLEIIQYTDCVIGLSGTISKETENNLWQNFNLEILINYSSQQAIKDGLISDYNINIITVPLDNIQKLYKNKAGVLITEKQKYNAYTYVIEGLKAKRQNYMHLALHRNRILQSSINKIKKLKEMIQNPGRYIIFTGLAKVADNLGIPSYHSKSKDESSIDMFLEKKINKLALAVTGGIGVSYQDLDGVILSNFTYDSQETSQILARCLMLDYVGKTANIYIVSSNEEVELKKLKATLEDFDQSKIKYLQ